MRKLVSMLKDLQQYNYKLCDIDYGLDCFTMIIRYLEYYDIRIDREAMYKDLEVFNYKEIFNANPERLMEIAADFVATKIEEIPENKIFAGDILLLQYKETCPSFAIDAGNGAALIATVNGLVFMAKKQYKILRSFRCPR